MEDFTVEELHDIVAAAVASTTAEIREKKEKVGTHEREEQIDVAKHEAYMKLGVSTVVHIARTYYSNYALREVEEFYKDGSCSKLSAVGVAVPNEMKDFPISWLATKVMAGWNTGIMCSNFQELNRAALFGAQVETVPVNFKDAEGKIQSLAVLTKCRYDAVPYLPSGQPQLLSTVLFCVKEKGLQARSMPVNLMEAYAATKTPWIYGAMCTSFLTRAKTFCPHVPNAFTLAYLLAGNFDNITNRIKDIDPAVCLTIKPVTSQSIFAGRVLSDWSSFFDGFAYDRYGTVSAARALSSLAYDGYYGELSDVAVWAQRRSVLKVPNQIETIIAHKFLPHKDFKQWPNCPTIAYTPTPAFLKLCISSCPELVALAIPLTAVISNAPQVDTFCSRFTYISVTVLCCSPPLVVFAKEDAGFIGSSVAKQLSLLEKAIVMGFVEKMKAWGQKSERGNFTAFDLVPDKDYSAAKCSIDLRHYKIEWNHVSYRYVSQKDIELDRFIPTSRMADVMIRGKRVAEEVELGIPNYPRCNPKFIGNLDEGLKLKTPYWPNSGIRADEFVNAAKGFKLYSWAKGKATETYDPPGPEADPWAVPGAVPVDVGGGMPEPAAAPEEGEYVPPGPMPPPDMPPGGDDDEEDEEEEAEEREGEAEDAEMKE